MKKSNYRDSKIIFLLGLILIVTVGCERELSDDVEFATFPKTAEVFIDGFSGGLNYFPFSGSKANAFGQRSDRQHDAGHVDALAFRQLAADDHAGLGEVGAAGLHHQAQLVALRRMGFHDDEGVRRHAAADEPAEDGAGHVAAADECEGRGIHGLSVEAVPRP